MLILVAGNTVTVSEMPDDSVGHLLTPAMRTGPERFARAWAADNGAFGGLDEPAFRAMLGRINAHVRCSGEQPLFVVVPDHVGQAGLTLASWREWRDIVRGELNLPLAYVSQDGEVSQRVPWGDMAALFVGGTDAWKFSRESIALMEQAKARGLWLHIGRVNSLARLAQCRDLGADSVDGSHWSRFEGCDGKVSLRRAVQTLDALERQAVMAWDNSEDEQ